MRDNCNELTTSIYVPLFIVVRKYITFVNTPLQNFCHRHIPPTYAYAAYLHVSTHGLECQIPPHIVCLARLHDALTQFIQRIRDYVGQIINE